MLAVAACVAMICIGAVFPRAIDAFQVIGGKSAGADPQWLRIALFADFVLPTAYGTGMVLLACALGGEGVRGLAASIAAIAALIGTSADYCENGLVVFQVANAGRAALPFTLVKYGTLAISFGLIGALLPANNAFMRLVSLLLRYLTPLSLALLVSGLGGPAVDIGFGLALATTFLLVALVCRQLAQSR